MNASNDIKHKSLISLIPIFVMLISCGRSAGPHKPVGAELETRPPQVSGISFLDVQPIFMSRCSPCHNYASDFGAVHALSESGSNSLVYRYVIEGNPRQMPPPGSPQAVAMTQEERLMIGEWVLAGAPNGDSDRTARFSPNGLDSEELSREALRHMGELVVRVQNCESCHSPYSGVPGALPLKGLTAPYIAQQLFDYRSGKRISVSMQPVAQSMSTDEIRAVALWYESAAGGDGATQGGNGATQGGEADARNENVQRNEAAQGNEAAQSNEAAQGHEVGQNNEVTESNEDNYDLGGGGR